MKAQNMMITVGRRGKIQDAFWGAGEGNAVQKDTVTGCILEMMELSEAEILQGCRLGRLSVYQEVRRRYGFGEQEDEFVWPPAKFEVTAGYTGENVQYVIGDVGARSK